MSYQIHHLADCQSKNIGDGTRIWQFCVVFPNAQIGSNCNICANVLIENYAVVGNDVTIKSGVQLWDGVILEDKVFVGPNVTFTNDIVPRSQNRDYCMQRTVVRNGASIGANSTIVCGVELGEYSFIGAGSVITKNIPSNTIWYGNPAVHRGYMTSSGIILDMEKRDKNGVIRSFDE